LEKQLDRIFTLSHKATHAKIQPRVFETGMTWAYGNSGPSPRHDSQARKPQLGVSRRFAPTLETEFELRATQLQLTPQMYAASVELRSWCRQNKNRCYVPEWLLEAWSVTVDPTFSDAT
jgi:hypothetical protein